MDKPGPDIQDRVDLLLAVVAQFELIVSGNAVFQEDDLPIVELRLALGDWQTSRPLTEREDFEYSSIEYPPPSLFWFRRHVGTASWRVGSVQTPEWADQVPGVELEEAVSDYIRGIDAAVRTMFNIDVTEFLAAHPD